MHFSSLELMLSGILGEFLKKNFLIFSTIAALALLLYSWSTSYPLSLNLSTDFIFNHVNPLYWIGLALLLGSIGTAVANAKREFFVLIMCVAILVCMYSLYYFYPSLPGSDTNTFRGLTEYALTTGDLNPLGTNHNYFQWPGFFVFSQILLTLTGLQTIPFEFVFFTLLGVLYVVTLYVYFSSFSRKLAWVSLATYFIIIYLFFNYQYAPFSLAMALLFTLFMIETRSHKTGSMALLTLILCIGISIIHPFAVIFFIAYVFVMYLLGREKYYLRLFGITLVTWLLVTMFSSGIFFNQLLQAVTALTSQEYISSFQAALSNPIANLPAISPISQIFSRGTIIITATITGIGFILFLVKRRLRRMDLALAISAIIYSLVGAILPVLGQRAWFILLMPLSLGTVYFLEKGFGRYLKYLFIAFLVLFTFVPLSSSFNNTQVFFLTRNERVCTDFAVLNYDWSGLGSVLAHFRLVTYLEARTGGTIQFGSEFQFTNTSWSTFPENIPSFNCIIYTSGLAQSTVAYNYTISDLWQKQNYNKLYDSGQSYILINFGS
jgi:hypothetical protein